MEFEQSQSLNKWNEMIGSIYDGTQNYSKSRYEIHCHLTEVTGAFCKMLFKKKDYRGSLEFLPKMFAWATTLFRKVNGPGADLERAIMIKFPGACSYCLELPCKCWATSKPEIQVKKAKMLFQKNYTDQDRSVNGLQLMFRNIYGESWGLKTMDTHSKMAPLDMVKLMFTRMMEELSETAEAMRFHHLYPSNFNNEIADYFAWWFAIVTNFHLLNESDVDALSAEEILWEAYPNFCLPCGLQPCDCRPGPVRELLSKPSLKDLSLIDGLTQAENQTSFNKLIKEITLRVFPVALPIACVRMDVDDFKKFNNEISHFAGDLALKTLVTLLRKKLRQRDRIFRVGGDEFAIVCQDLSSQEATGMITRFMNALSVSPIKGQDDNGKDFEKNITVSVGIVSCEDPLNILEVFKAADKAAISSKEAGKNRITIQ